MTRLDHKVTENRHALIVAWLKDHGFTKGRVYGSADGYVVEWQHRGCTVLVQDLGPEGFEIHMPASASLKFADTFDAIEARLRGDS